MARKKLVVIGGATGVGKSSVAMSLANHFRTGIINADSRQVYSELNIGVGKPSAEERATIPHYLVGHVGLNEKYSVGRFTAEVNEVLSTAFAGNDIAILCGGTGLYLKAVLTGLDYFPDVPDDIALKWEKIWKTKGLDFLAEQLRKHDPVYAERVDLKNPARLLRALAVMEATGKRFSSFQGHPSLPREYETICLLMDRPREELYDRINKRVQEMIGAGWLEEVQTLLPFRHLRALNTVGYKELFLVADGTISLDAAIPMIQQSTRHFAKRQLTWFRHQGTWTVFHPDDLKQMIDFIEMYTT